MDITNILAAIITLLCAVLTGFVIPYVKSKTTKNQQEIISTIADTAVYAAQQLLDDDTSKKEYAMDKVSEWLTERGMTVDAQEISDAIEAAVKRIKGTW